MSALVKGLLLGVSIAAPVGPIGILCIRTTLAQGRTYGFVAGLGAATADAVYGTVAAIGLTSVSRFLLGQASAIQAAGALFLLFLAYRTLRSPVAGLQSLERSGKNALRIFASTFALTMTNPMTILSFLGIFAGLNLGPLGSADAAALVGGVFLGSALWWLCLSLTVGMFRRMIGQRVMTGINWCAGCILLAFGLYSLYNVLV